MIINPASLNFIFKMVWREARGSYRRFPFFIFSIAIGVGSIVGSGNIAASLKAMTLQEARNLLAADIEALPNQPLTSQTEPTDLLQKGVRFIHVTELVGMAMTEDLSRSQLVEMKAVEPGYPFYGRFKTDPPELDPFHDPKAVWVEEALLIRLHLQVQDRLKLGDALFIIRGIIRKEPDRIIGMFSLGPRLLLSQEGLRRTGLVQPGSRITHRYLFQTGPSWTPEGLKAELSKRWAGPVRIRTYQEVQPRMARFLENFMIYLGLGGLITLMIGGIGVAITIHTFLNGRIGTIAVLKCLGGTSSMIQAVYLSLTLILGGIGGLAGVLLGMGIHLALLSFLSAFLPSDFQSHTMILPAVRGMVMGLLATLLFSLWPLRVIRRIPPFRIFRQEAEVESKNLPGRTGWLLAAGLVVCWMGLSVWQAGSWRLGAWAVGAVVLSLLFLLAASFGFAGLMKRISRALSVRPGSGRGPLILRYGIGNLHRPGRLIVTIVLSVGIGVMALLTLAQVERSLMYQIKLNIPENAPSFFFIDLQPDQKESFEATVKKWEFKKPMQLIPLVRSRLYDVNGKKVSEMNTENRPDGWYFTREYVLTFQKDLPEHNSLRRGKWWTETPRPVGREDVPSISVETEAARHLGIDLGSTVTFDIQGDLVSAKVASIRDVDWGSFTTNFFFIFSPGALERAPVTYVATVATRPEEDLALQNAVIGTFPNVTAIHIREVLEIISRILKEITRSVRFMASFGLLAGLIILAAAIAATRVRRLREMILFKTLGATRMTLIAIMAVEYGMLGFVAAIVGGALSTALSWGIVHFFLDIPWRFDPVVLLTGLIVTTVLTVLTGFMTTYRILGQKPLAVLRSE